MSVIYPGDQRVPDALHTAFAIAGIHPENGEDVDPAAQALIDAIPTAEPQGDTRKVSEADPAEEEDKPSAKSSKK